jgi:hypothetical protein
MNRDTDLIRRGDAISWCDKWIATFGAVEIRHTSAREYALDAVKDLRDALHSIPAHPAQEPPGPGVTAGVGVEALRALAQAYDREDAAQRGEPDPWMLDDPGDIGDSDMWVSERLACARVASEAFLSALAPVVPAARLARASVTDASVGWTLDLEMLQEFRAAAGDWGYSLDLEAVEQIALAVEAHLRSAPPVGARVKPLVWGPYDNPVFAGPDVAIADVEFSHRYQVQRDPRAATYIAFLHPRLPITSSTLWWESKGHADLEAAKAAAQADYEARILAALLPAEEGE